jgi:hypothetical protein
MKTNLDFDGRSINEIGLEMTPIFRSNGETKAPGFNILTGEKDADGKEQKVFVWLSKNLNAQWEEQQFKAAPGNSVILEVIFKETGHKALVCCTPQLRLKMADAEVWD